MALLLMEGWDCYLNGTADVIVSGTGWTRSGPASHTQIDDDGGRFGGGALLTASSNSSYLQRDLTISRGQTVFCAFAMKNLGGATANEQIAVFRTAAGVALFGIQATAIGYLTAITQSGTPSPPSKLCLFANTWHWVEFFVTFGTNATSGAYEVRVDGETILSASGIDTDNGNDPTILRLYAAEGGRLFDDVIVWNSAGSSPTTWIGDTRIDTLVPDGDTATVDWTASAGADYTCVDEVIPNDDTDYIASQTSTQESRFTFTDLSGASVTVHAAQTRVRARREDTVSSRSYRSLINSGGTEATGTTQTDPGTTYVTRNDGLFTVNPNGGGAWDDTAVNALEAGVEIT